MKVVAFKDIPRKDGNPAQRRFPIKGKVIKLLADVTKLFKVSDKLPVICIFGQDDLNLVTPICED